MFDTEAPRGIMTRLIRRDAGFNSDYFAIEIDGYHDHLGRAHFGVNPSGSKDDDIGVGTSCCDGSWDPVWEAAAHIDADGWTAEMRIPFSQLRYARDSVQTWGLQLIRHIHRRNETAQWAFWKKTETGGPARFGHLDGLRIARSSRHLEVLPYTVARSANLRDEAGDPFNTHGRPTTRAGLDLKYLLTDRKSVV